MEMSHAKISDWINFNNDTDMINLRLPYEDFSGLAFPLIATDEMRADGEKGF